MYKMSKVPLIENEKIQKRILNLADEIKDFDYDILVSLLTGAFIFTADLCRALSLKQKNPEQKEVCFIKASSYGNSTESSKNLKVTGLEKLDLKNKKVLLVDDIADTGFTLKNLVNSFNKIGAKEIRTCVLLNKKARREVDFTADFVGFEIENEFVVGYGLDYAGKFRTLSDIWTLQE